MSQEKEPTEAQLSVKDRMNTPFLLASQILTIQKSMLIIGEDSEKERKLSIKGIQIIRKSPISLDRIFWPGYCKM